MRLPPRAFWTLTEAAARWGCMATDIVGWAGLGKLKLTVSVPPVRCGSETVAGFAIVPAQDILKMFRRDGTGPASMSIRRLQVAGQEEWLYITDPDPGVEVHREDIIITAEEAQRFEALYVATPSTRTPPPPPERRYDWDAFTVALVKRVYEHGLPPSQNEWIRESLDWFSQRDPSGEAPDERTMRRRIQPIWQALREGDAPEAA